MSKRWIGVSSFFLGFLVALAVGRLGHSVSAQSSAATQPPNRISDLGREIDEGNEGLGFPRNLRAIPRVAPLEQFPIVARSFFSKQTGILDGLDCRGCVFSDTHFVYGGGAFNLQDVHFSGAMTVEFTGAAANTLNFLHFMDSLQQPKGAIEQPQNNKTIEKKPEIKRQPTEPISFGPSFIGAR